MKEIHELAERLETKRLVYLRLNLFGFAFGGMFRIIETYLTPSYDHIIFTILGLLGAFIWTMSLFQLLWIGRKIQGDDRLKQFFNDELATQTQLKSWKTGFIAVLVTQSILIIVSLFQPYEGLFATELTLYVAICATIGASIVQEEMLSISLFHMEIDEVQYDIWNWKSISFFHWIINPGPAFNELVVGQRAPKLMLIDKQSDKPFGERCYVPCPSCETIHSNYVWSSQNKTAFKNYYGLYCPSCGEIIPCLRNAFSVVLIAITYPFWFWRQDQLKAKWLAKQPARFQNITEDSIKPKKVNWMKAGALFGLVAFVFMTFIFKAALLVLEEDVTDYISYFFEPSFLIINLVVWSLTGFIFGYTMKRLMAKKVGDKKPLMLRNIFK